MEEKDQVEPLDHIHEARAGRSACAICGERIPDDYRWWLLRYHGTVVLADLGVYRILTEFDRIVSRLVARR